PRCEPVVSCGERKLELHGIALDLSDQPGVAADDGPVDVLGPWAPWAVPGISFGVDVLLLLLVVLTDGPRLEREPAAGAEVKAVGLAGVTVNESSVGDRDAASGTADHAEAGELKRLVWSGWLTEDRP